MRKFEDLTLEEQKQVSTFIEKHVSSETEERYTRKTKAELTVNSLEIEAIIGDEEHNEVELMNFYCGACEEPLGHTELIEHVMIHLKLE